MVDYSINPFIPIALKHLSYFSKVIELWILPNTLLKACADLRSMKLKSFLCICYLQVYTDLEGGWGAVQYVEHFNEKMQ